MSGSTGRSDPKGKERPTKNQGESGEVQSEGYSAEQFVTASTMSGTSSYFTVSPSMEPPPVPKEEIELAVLAHIQAIRALGRTKINTQEIADALGLSIQEVNDVVQVLKAHGVTRLRE
jgi:hypothetical protein